MIFFTIRGAYYASYPLDRNINSFLFGLTDKYYFLSLHSNSQDIYDLNCISALLHWMITFPTVWAICSNSSHLLHASLLTTTYIPIGSNWLILLAISLYANRIITFISYLSYIYMHKSTHVYLDLITIHHYSIQVQYRIAYSTSPSWIMPAQIVPYQSTIAIEYTISDNQLLPLSIYQYSIHHYYAII